jgi:hypothetical protein
MDPTGSQVKLPGLHTTEPTFGLPATWVDVAQKDEASMKGYTVVDAATVLSTHLTELLKANTAELLSYAEVHKLIKELPKEQGELVKDIVPSQITVSGMQRVLQLLLNERVSIRDLATILEGIADALSFTRNPISIAEHVRTRLARQLCAQHTTPAGYLAADRAVGQVGAEFCGVDRRHRRRQEPRHVAVAAVGIHYQRARAVRGRRPRGRGVGAGDVAADPAVRARDRRAFPLPDQRPVAVGNPSAGCG